MTLAQSEHFQRRMDRAHRRLLSTFKTLATVRRLALPVCKSMSLDSKSINSTLGVNMKMLPQSIFAQALREWMNSDESGRNADRSPNSSSRRPLSGHFGYSMLVFDMVDGKLYQTAETEKTFEPESELVVAEDERKPEIVKAA